MSDKQKMPKIEPLPARYFFFLNPYTSEAFTRCPKCEGKTRMRKHCLVIHVEPRFLLVINKTCRFCPPCELIIAKRVELDPLVAEACQQFSPESTGKDYLVMGTMDRKDWKEAQTSFIAQAEAMNRVYLFKNIWKFEIRGGWCHEEE